MSHSGQEPFLAGMIKFCQWWEVEMEVATTEPERWELVDKVRKLVGQHRLQMDGNPETGKLYNYHEIRQVLRNFMDRHDI